MSTEKESRTWTARLAGLGFPELPDKRRKPFRTKTCSGQLGDGPELFQDSLAAPKDIRAMGRSKCHRLGTAPWVRKRAQSQEQWNFSSDTDFVAPHTIGWVFDRVKKF